MAGNTRVHVVLHGGEPLLAGPARLRRAAGALRSTLAGVCDLDLRIHTNGVLLDEEFCELFAECGIGVGVSIDGYRAANDRHRRYADGRSSYGQVLRAVDWLRTEGYRDLYAGLLCTIDVANDPVAVYESLLNLTPYSANSPPSQRNDHNLSTDGTHWLDRKPERSTIGVSRRCFVIPGTGPPEHVKLTNARQSHGCYAGS